MSITLHLPPNIEESLIEEWPDLSRKALEAFALEAYREELLSRGQVSELLGLGFHETEVFLKQHGAYLPYDEEELEVDLQSARILTHR